METPPSRIQRARAREDKLIAIIVAMARNGMPCPESRALAEMTGYGSSGSVSEVILRLQRNGLLTNRRTGRGRIVGIPSLGIETAHPDGWTRDGKARRSIAKLIAIAAEISCLSVEDITGGERGRLYIRPRFLACHFAKAEGWSILAIAREMGRDHSTIIHACDQIPILLKHDKLFARMFRRMEDRLAGVVPQPVIVPIRRIHAAAQPAPAKRWEGDETAERSHRTGSNRLIQALKREHPLRCAA